MPYIGKKTRPIHRGRPRHARDHRNRGPQADLQTPRPQDVLRLREPGSSTEQTFRENSSDFDKIRLRQRIAVDMAGRTTASTDDRAGCGHASGAGPGGLDAGCRSADGEIKAARAAEKFGVPLLCRTMSICSIEDVAETHVQAVLVSGLHAEGRRFHAAPVRPRQGRRRLPALVITVDLQMLGQRHKDLKNGLSAPPKLTPASMPPCDQGALGAGDAAEPSGASSAISWAMPRA